MADRLRAAGAGGCLEPPPRLVAQIEAKEMDGDGFRLAAQHRELRNQRWFKVTHVGAEDDLDVGHEDSRGGWWGGPG